MFKGFEKLTKERNEKNKVYNTLSQRRNQLKLDVCHYPGIVKNEAKKQQEAKSRFKNLDDKIKRKSQFLQHLRP